MTVVDTYPPLQFGTCGRSLGVNSPPRAVDAQKNRIRHLFLFVLCFFIIGIPAYGEQAGELRLATFNIQNFGWSKVSKPDVRRYLSRIVRKFDIVAVQEISDVQNRVPDAFLAEINTTGREYAYLVSERTGKQPDDRTSQEQYGFFYDTKRVVPFGNGELFDDNSHDLFQREPFTAHFKLKTGSISLTITQVHTRPESAVKEIEALYDVFQSVLRSYPTETRHVILGDFNGSCTYASPAQLSKLKVRRRPFTWVVPDDTDTTVSPTTHCAYDRIVVDTPLKARLAGWGVGTWFNDKKVSDHWPVWVVFKSGSD